MAARCVMVDDAVFGGGHRRQGSGDLGVMAARHRRQGSGDFGNLRLGRTGSGTIGLPTPAAGVSGITTCASSRRTTTAKLEAGCRLALSEVQIQSEGRPHHRRQNSLSQALEGLDLEEAFPSENKEVHDKEAVHQQPPCASELGDTSFDLSMSMSCESKTARRRARYDSKSRNITFNQKKHMTPSYLRRLQRRKLKDESEAMSRASNPGCILAALEAAV